MPTLLVVEDLPLLELFSQSLARQPKIGTAPELDPIRLLGTLDLAVKMRRTRRRGTKLDLLLLEQLLKGFGHELGATIRLDSLNGKGQFGVPPSGTGTSTYGAEAIQPQRGLFPAL